MGLGTWQLITDTPATIETALNLGYRMIDTSGDYGTQPGIGEALRHTDVPRGQIYVVTKVEETDDAYKATKKNLKELQIEYVDLMLIHRPPETGTGEELWRGLMRAKKEGLAKDIGVSNYSTKLIQDLIDATGEVPVVNQIEWSPFGWSDEMLDFTKKNNMIIMAYSPLTRTTRLDNKILKKVSAQYNKTPAQIIIRWNLQLGTIPLPKANQEKHLIENTAVFDFEISETDMKTLKKMNEHYSALGEELRYLK